MELWIRSQDKEVLILANHLDIYNVCFDGEVKTWNIEESGINLGEYRTKERALEVLDEIQNLLKPMLAFKNCNCTQEMLDNIKEAGACVVSDNAHIEQIQTCIYEMPKE